MSTIRLQDVTKTFVKPLALGRQKTAQNNEDNIDASQELAALDHIDLTIPDGQTCAIVGPSGCGKSTLLRVVAGLETDYTGQVFYDDQEMTGVAPKERYIGMVFQNYALYPHFEGQGNLSFFFKVRKIADKEAEERIKVTSEIMGIGFNALLERKPGTLSGGQQQRLAIARAIVRNPRLFLFDEPLSNLDAKLRMQTRIEIKRLLRRFQITALYVTHDQTEAIALGDQIVVMRAGKVEQMGPYLTLLQRPVNTFVAGFIGAPPMSLFSEGKIGDGLLHLGEMTLPLPEAVKAHVHAGQAVILGARPEAAQWGDGHAVVAAGLRLRGVIEVIEPDFARRTQLLYLQTGVFAYTALVPLDESLAIGQTVEVVFPADQLHFFDQSSEQRLG
ncbi:MAG: ATP-binding cassette domain-containing protein [Chloroflexi bacterium]|nr:ATP-binding cassette domain-containing protein [Chloroflexota bacterium]